MFSIEYQKLLHARSMNNRGALLDSKECGCFFCIRLYSPEIITQWINDETARCAFCGVDAVIPEMLTAEARKQLNAYHRKVYEKVAPHLNEEERAWLEQATREV